MTGFSLFDFSLGGKWLDLVKEFAPHLERIVFMLNPDTAPYSKFFMPVIESAATSLGVQVIPAPVRAEADIEPALALLVRQPNGGLMLQGDSFTRLHQKLIANLALRFAVPSIASSTDFAKDGGLMDYSPYAGVAEQYRQAAHYVDPILKGAKPADLPVQVPVKYKLVVNLKAAKALGLTVPPSLLARAGRGV